jgi:hypothetical protein
MLRSVTSIVGAAFIGAAILITAGMSAKKALALFRAEPVPLASISPATPPASREVATPKVIPEPNPVDEDRRRNKVFADIIAEYPKSTDGCPSNPPLDWINAKLRERGEEWQMIPRAQTSITEYNTFVGPCNSINVEARSAADVGHNTLIGPHNSIHVAAPNATASGNFLLNDQFSPPTSQPVPPSVPGKSKK